MRLQVKISFVELTLGSILSPFQELFSKKHLCKGLSCKKERKHVFSIVPGIIFYNELSLPKVFQNLKEKVFIEDKFNRLFLRDKSYNH